MNSVVIGAHIVSLPWTPGAVPCKNAVSFGAFQPTRGGDDLPRECEHVFGPTCLGPMLGCEHVMPLCCDEYVNKPQFPSSRYLP